MADKKEFIGVDALTTVAESVGSQVILGPAYKKPELLKRLGFKVLTGVAYKQTETLLIRKGGTTRRKVVGETNKNKVGFMKSRPVTVKLTWNQFSGNQSQFFETHLTTGAVGDYPNSTREVEAIIKTYAEDLTTNLFFGDIDNENVEGKEQLSLYDGIHTCINKDIAEGFISKENKNLIECEAIVAPTDKNDTTPYDIVRDVYNKLDARLRDEDKIYCYCSTLVGQYICDGYFAKRNWTKDVTYLDEGKNFRIPELSNVIFAPSDAWGEGDRIAFSIPENFQYACDDEGDETYVRVKVGTDDDLDEVLFQIQSAQGTRLLNPLATAFAVTNGSIRDNLISGDYQNSLVSVLSSDTAKGTVTVNGEAYDEAKEYAPGTVLTLAASATSGNKFKQWSNGKKEATITVVTTGMPMALTAIFEANA